MTVLELSAREHRNYIALVRLFKNQKPRRRKRTSNERFSLSKKETILKEQNNTCPSCGVKYSKSTDRLPTMEHIIPWRYGGTRSRFNSILICHKCNQSTSNLRTLELIKVIESHYGLIDRSLIEDFDLEIIDEWWVDKV